MVFVAMRVADLCNAVTGLWVIPRHLPQESLGALLPLLSFGGLLALPITVLATVLSRQLCTDLVNGERLRAKGFLRDALLMTLGLLVVGLGLTALMLPRLCDLLRIPRSSAASLSVTYALLAAFVPLLTAALQAAQRFGTLAISNLVSAPVRLGTMFLLLPLYGLTGYFLAQLSSLFATVFIALIALAPLLRTEGRCPFGLWRPQLRAMSVYGLKVALGVTLLTIQASLTTFILRHRLADDATAAYYILTRFAEIATYCGSTLTLVLFPFAIQSHTQGQPSKVLRTRLFLITLLGGTLLAITLACVLPWLFPLFPDYRPYASLAWLSGPFTLIATLSVASGILMTHAQAVNDFTYLRTLLPATLLNAALLLLIPLHSLLTIFPLLLFNALLTLLACLPLRKNEAKKQIL